MPQAPTTSRALTRAWAPLAALDVKCCACLGKRRQALELMQYAGRGLQCLHPCLPPCLHQKRAVGRPQRSVHSVWGPGAWLCSNASSVLQAIHGDKHKHTQAHTGTHSCMARTCARCGSAVQWGAHRCKGKVGARAPEAHLTCCGCCFPRGCRLLSPAEQQLLLASLLPQPMGAPTGGPAPKAYSPRSADGRRANRGAAQAPEDTNTGMWLCVALHSLQDPSSRAG